MNVESAGTCDSCEFELTVVISWLKLTQGLEIELAVDVY